jgi:hypothetical protein
VLTVDNQAAGGVVGYSYTGTEVRDNFALNGTVTASAYAQRVVARIGSGHSPTLENNFAVETVVAETQSNTAVGPATLNGETKTVADAQAQTTWEDGLGWDFTDVWTWDGATQRPMLRGVQEEVSVAAREAPLADHTVERAATSEDADEDERALITHEAVLEQDGLAAVTVHAGAAAAGAQLSILLLDDDADADEPDVGDIVYANEVTLDDFGDATLRVQLPVPTLSGFNIALNTSAGTPRYVAALDPEESIKITVDGREVPFAKKRQTAANVLLRAGFDPDEYDLAEWRRNGKKLHTFRDGRPIGLKDGDTYEIVSENQPSRGSGRA